ncbi:uncharacterized protein ARMOST_17114 [Armillaria ostoyae]|uniref:Uncharacterized protein n=1 Tax=Armillaria ostoyae TaxID=47428 RepID=A0A284RY40_ARMOS|nr:uncharacterized protein ARMOST_17114 [Armillaria ostoyae]
MYIQGSILWSYQSTKPFNLIPSGPVLPGKSDQYEAQYGRQIDLIPGLYSAGRCLLHRCVLWVSLYTAANNSVGSQRIAVTCLGIP